jgi:hypothetical protein
VRFDLYAWSAPRHLEAAQAAALIDAWEAAGGDPAAAPFEPVEDVGWFDRELRRDLPGIDAVSDAVPNPSTRPIWLSTDPEPPARFVAIRLASLGRDAAADALEEILGLAAKYDLTLFDAQNERIHHPLDELAAYASATFWPAGAIQAAVAGGAGALIAAVAWLVGIPILSGVLVVVGGFMFVMSVFTFVHEGRIAIRSRSGSSERSAPGPPEPQEPPGPPNGPPQEPPPSA